MSCDLPLNWSLQKSEPTQIGSELLHCDVFLQEFPTTHLRFPNRAGRLTLSQASIRNDDLLIAHLFLIRVPTTFCQYVTYAYGKPVTQHELKNTLVPSLMTG